MLTDWRVYGSSTVLSSLDKSEFPGFFQNLIVGPNETAVIIRDGQIEESITGTRKSISGLWDNFKKLWGRSSNLEVIFVDTSPIDFAFYVGSSSRREDGTLTGEFSDTQEDAYRTMENRSRRQIDTTDLTIKALTKDGQNVSAEVNVTLQLKAENAPLLTSLLRGRRAVADWDIAALVRDELLAKSVVPLIGQHTGSDIRGNRALMTEIAESSERTLIRKFNLYGLQLINMFVNWGLTDEDELMIAEGRKDREERAIEFDHTRRVREQERELEVERQRISNLQELKTLETSGDLELQEIILTNELNRDNLVDGKRVSQAAVTAQVREIELDIAQKETLLKVDLTKAEADARFAIERREALFEQEKKQMESDRSMSKMAELSKLHTQRQQAKQQSELNADRQASEAAAAELTTRLDAARFQTEQEQETIRQALHSSSGAADPSVLRDMLREGTNRVVGDTANRRSDLSESDTPAQPQEGASAGPDNRTATPHNVGSHPSFTPTDTTCASCASPIKNNWKLCPQCGTAVVLRCRNCSAELQSTWINCPLCGFPAKP